MSARPGVVILGAGGHGHVLLEVLRLQDEADVLGLLDDDEDLQGTRTRGDIEVIGRTDFESLRKCEADAFVVAIGNNRIRRMLFNRALEAGLAPWTAIHPSAVIAKSATIGDGTQVIAGAIVNSHASIGVDVVLNTGSTVDHDNTVGDHAFLAPGVHLGGDVQVGAGAFIGIGASVLPGISVGAGATVGGGAVVIQDVPPGAVVVGVPAHVIRTEPAEQ